MTDINDWIKERRTIHDAASEGPWEEIATSESSGVTSPALTGDEAVVEDMYMMSFDRAAIVDAHNTLPKLTAALRAVLNVLDSGVRDGDSADLIRRVALQEIEDAIND